MKSVWLKFYFIILFFLLPLTGGDAALPVLPLERKERKSETRIRPEACSELIFVLLREYKQKVHDVYGLYHSYSWNNVHLVRIPTPNG
ncbi:uncharacterized protein EAE97_003243 [Botrytis byssoidea]|uniref:Uncharacterized protein n=1 Tax=Botrytis byssoidea TaxID=139641 RepID=A0A9P5IUE9_9HELO|nr:uncharacterized protein EAE97_003243 [Botrytis byssoidea]KAF7949734.1 hypothetical protein EAE97_003243 [Botrytis byssoidea]